MKSLGLVCLVLLATIAACGDDDGGGGGADARQNPDGPRYDGPPTADGPATPDAGTADAAGADGSLDASTAPGDSCESATAITAGSLPGQTTVGYANDYELEVCTGFAEVGPDRVYAIEVAAGMVLTATVSPDTDFDASVAIVASLADCTVPEPTCADGADVGSSGDPETAQYRNGGAAPVTVFVIVDSYGSAGDTFTLDTAVATPPVTGDTCAAPEVIATAGTLSGHTTEGYTDDLNDRDESCTGWTTTGFDRVYAITVPGLERLDVSLAPAVVDLSLYLIGSLASCTADPTCADGSDVGTGMGVEAVSWLNETTTPAQLFIVVDSYYPTGGVYDLTTTLTALGAGEVCANAIPIAATATVTGTSGASGEYDAMTSCTGYSTTGPDRVYQVVIPAGQTLTATVTPTTSGADPALYLLAMDGCTATPACLAGSDGVDADPAETVTYTNAALTPATVYIVVDSYYSDAFDFSLTTSTI